MTRIRFATYNIHGAIGRDRRCDPERIASVLNEIDADVVALQEVDARHGGLDKLAFLGGQTGLTPIAGPTILRKTGDYGNAVLARCPFIEVHRVDISVADREPRGALDLTLACRGARLRLLATHLGLRPAERRDQIDALLGRLGPADPMPTVLMGDLNEWFLWGRPLRWLHRYFEETPAPATFPARVPLLALDRLWVKPRNALRRLSVHASPLARIASDHLPLVAEVELVDGEGWNRAESGAENGVP